MLTLVRCLSHPRVTAGARKRPRSPCQKCTWQLTHQHTYILDSIKSEWDDYAVEITLQLCAFPPFSKINEAESLTFERISLTIDIYILRGLSMKEQLLFNEEKERMLK